MSGLLKNIVVIGASGNLGPYILKALTADSSFNTTIITRKTSEANFDSYPGLKIVRVTDSYPEEELLPIFQGQDVVVLSTGYRSDDKQVSLIESAIKAGVKRIIPAAFGNNSLNKRTQDIFPFGAGTAKVVDFLKTKESTGITWTVIANGFFLDYVISTGFLGYDLNAHKATIWDSGDVKFSTTTRSTVGKAVLGVLQQPEKTANKFLYIASFEPTMNEILACLEKLTSPPAWKITHVDSEEQIAKGKEELKAGNFAGMSKLALAVYVKGGCGNCFGQEEKLANELLGLPKEDLEEVLGDILKVKTDTKG